MNAARQAAVDAGRQPDSIKVLALLTVIVADTEEAAEDLYQSYVKQGSAEGALALFGGWTGIDLSSFGEDQDLRDVTSDEAGAKSNAIKSAVEGFAKSAPEVGTWTKQAVADQLTVGGLGPVVRGSVTSVANQLESWVDEAGVDGFNFAYAVTPGTQVDLVDKLIPELQRRGHVWDEYPSLSTQVQQAGKRTVTGQPGFGEGAHPGLTAREHLYGVGQSRLREDHWASRLSWKAGQPAPPLKGHASTSSESLKRGYHAQVEEGAEAKKAKVNA